ncbi:hypothetical protein ACFQ1S_03530 [Kibdelosporangium lantanae]|uniref:Uncharacterized protein n=1 Tax=Kibdelosporangium lantanae TaxID=1497396 RepID=A0ABW3M3P0_9PSEU
MTDPATDDTDRTVTFTGPVEITGDVAARKIVHNYSVVDTEPVRELARAQLVQADLLQQGHRGLRAVLAADP